MSAVSTKELPETNSDQMSDSSRSSIERDDDTQLTTPCTSSPPSECGHVEMFSDVVKTGRTIPDMTELYSENITAKVLRTAQAAVGSLPGAFPEIVPQGASSNGSYVLREAEFWTCGFFPGTLGLMLEWLIRYPHSIELADVGISISQLRSAIKSMFQTWMEPLYGMDDRTDTHDLGFIIMPALRLNWELSGDIRSLDSIIRAARSLATRWVPSAKVLRSWDLLKKKDIEILDQKTNVIVIIDSMCNLDLLYYASRHAKDPSLAEMATAHAMTVLKSHLRPEPALTESKECFKGQWFSTCHVADIDPQTGEIKCRLSAQGYDSESTWSRGQAWAILGYAQTYAWTKDCQFLDVACGLAEYFLYRIEGLPSSVMRGKHVPLWDFDAPSDDDFDPLRDSSAGVIAANGMLMMSEALFNNGSATLALRYRNAAMTIVQDTLDFALAPERAVILPGPYQSLRAAEHEPGYRFDSLLKFGTANNNASARKRYANHGLVYGDYYLVEFGNRLLRMGLA
ncbi:Unsaturated glucuronyl hydrolase [Pseudocercospora fuligena]|uniref:Unsaturated glucuronyl hydrolase n=1 Tax=Pseudocercospora fuligena TaxID=685502 RepID=A0A8H6RGU8_9PEZI|nr:Unsaturated glucuronyl hydrolase [Pseudocercospora fuligena]